MMTIELRLICQLDYFNPQLKRKLNELREKLRKLLQIERKRLVLKKIQPWNSVKVTFDIPKKAVEQLRMLASRDNQCLIDLGILSIEIVGQLNTILVKNASTTIDVTRSSEDQTQ